MNENTVVKRSVYIAIIGSLLMLILGIITKDISYFLGFVLGYVINVIVFLLIIKMTEGILKYSMSVVIVSGMFLLKLALYALGFVIAIKSPYVHLIGVFLGYMVTKLSIYFEGYVHKGGE